MLATNTSARSMLSLMTDAKPHIAAKPVNVNGKLLTTDGFEHKEAETGGK